MHPYYYCFGSGKKKLTPPDPDVALFINQLVQFGEVSNAEVAALNYLIPTLKSAGHWNTIDRIYPISPSSATGALCCAKTRLYMQNINGMAWSQTGFVGDGGTTCLEITNNLSTFTNATFNGCHVHMCTNGIDYDGTQGPNNGMFGAATASGGIQMFFNFDINSPGEFYTNMTAGWMSIDAEATGPDPSDTPFQVFTALSLESKSVLNVFNQPSGDASNYAIKYTGTQFTGTTQTFPALFPYVGAINYGNGHPEILGSLEIRSLVVGGPRTQTQSISMNQIMYNYQAMLGLGRETGV